ncbi:MAG TPA: hypothetical protein VJ483_05290 [Holophagaceae bacterium]|nr:hypothetical protein [Holophagaceae bacterium]
MSSLRTLPRLTILGFALAASLSAADAPARQRLQAAQAGKSEADDAEGRRAWNRYWFGDVTPEYLVFKNRAAALEVDRWRGTFPQGGNRPAPLAAAAATGPAWTNLGPDANSISSTFPDIDSGRPVSVVTDPTDNKILYLAVSGGGVWKCTNADLAAAGDWTWTPITDGLPTSSASGNVSVGALAMSPADHLTLYLALGDAFDAAGTGIYVTHDGGASWTPATLTGGTPTRSYDILALDANKILVGTNAGLFRSTDGGTNFAVVGGGLTPGEVWSVQHFTATELACTVQDSAGNGTIWYSSDAGATWNKATNAAVSPARITVATSPASTSQGWGLYEDANGDIARGLLKTTDKGHTWTFVAAPTTSGGLFQGIGGSMSTDGGQGFYNHGIAVDPANINNVFVGANLALYRTMNGGGSWQQMTHWYGDRHVYAHADFHCTSWAKDPAAPKTLYIGNDGGLCIVRDPLRTTIPTGAGTVPSDPTFIDNRRNKGLASHLVYNLGSTTAAAPTGAQYEISLGMQDNGTRIRQGTGAALQTSSTFDDQIGGDGFGTVIHQTDGTKMLGSVYYTDIYRSTNSGGSFSEAISGITEATQSANAPFAPKIALGQTSAPDTVYTFTNPTVYKSTNWASSWSAMNMTGFSSANPTGIIRNINGSRGSSAVAIASNGGRFWLNYSGSSWVTAGDITGGTLNTSYVWFDTTNDQIVYGATVAPNGSAHHLFKTTNGGTSWTFIDQTAGGGDNGFPFGIPVHVIQNDPSNHNTLYVGTDFGVYRSTDAGSSWVRYGTGLPMVAVRDLYIANDGSFVRAATFGRGVWELLAQAGITVALDKPSVTLAVSTGTSFTATLSNTTVNNTANWTATSGTFSATNTASGTATTYTAPATVGSFTVTATSVEDGTKKAMATITTYNPATLAVTVAPGTKGLLTGGTQTFTATVVGAPSNAVAWTTTGGNITAGGVFTAPATTGTYTITATAPYPTGANTGTATVTVRTLDLNADTKVDPFDLLNLAKGYGPATGPADFNGDNAIDDTDLATLLAGIQ